MSTKIKNLEERLKAHPELKEQILMLLELAESGIESADEVEQRTEGSVRGMGRQVLQDWAEQQAREKSDIAQDMVESKLVQKGKKNSTGTRRTER